MSTPFVWAAFDPTTPPASNRPQRFWVYLARAKAVFALVTVLITIAGSFVLAPLLRQVAVEQNVELSWLATVYLERPWIGADCACDALERQPEAIQGNPRQSEASLHLLVGLLR